MEIIEEISAGALSEVGARIVGMGDSLVRSVFGGKKQKSNRRVRQKQKAGKNSVQIQKSGLSENLEQEQEAGDNSFQKQEEGQDA
ncbi:MAG: hypothetical protein IJT01_03680 [Selenomonadaceae bacterium]|nr:hypothetical protein [Selenomonadaceae bacterium]